MSRDLRLSAGVVLFLGKEATFLGSLEGKKQVVESIKERLQKAQSVVIVENKGLKVSEATELRAKLRKGNVELKVLKNTLVKIAAEDAGVTGLDEYLMGPNAWAFSNEDPVSAAKILVEYSKTNKNLIVKGGILEGAALDEQGVKALAELPSKEELLAKLLSAMQSPLTGLANVLQGPIRKCAYALEAVRKEKENA